MSTYVASLSNLVHRVSEAQVSLSTKPVVITACGKWLTQGHNGIGGRHNFTGLPECKRCTARDSA